MCNTHKPHQERQPWSSAPRSRRSAQNARHVAAARPAKPLRGASRRRATEPAARQIKAWARLNGYEVADRGRVPGRIRDAYNEAH
ncbi:histone-like nucleoid-structuring protein Lsr2 [Kribbella orskensis]|uniref:Lsr2 family DNA-binding protein n=1 Tax=Kribbella TaxID=182639 RepID=UPI0018EEB296